MSLSFGHIFTNKYILTRRVETKNNELKTKLEGQLGHYLAGLIEGDGAIIVPKDNKNTPTIHIISHINDFPFFESLAKYLCYGSIQKNIKSNSVKFAVRSFYGLSSLVLLISGNFRKKKAVLHKLIKLLNVKIGNRNTGEKKKYY